MWCVGAGVSNGKECGGRNTDMRMHVRTRGHILAPRLFSSSFRSMSFVHGPPPPLWPLRAATRART